MKRQTLSSRPSDAIRHALADLLRLSLSVGLSGEIGQIAKPLTGDWVLSKTRTWVIHVHFVSRCLILCEVTLEMDFWNCYSILTLRCWSLRFSRYECLSYFGVLLFYFEIDSFNPLGTIDS
jgi:hypothetical protein